MKILVLGGYGLIGLSIVRRLQAEGYRVIGLGRSKAMGEAFAPTVEWLEADLTTLTDASKWAPYLVGTDAVINASGVLQNGGGDNVEATQQDAIIALISACEAHNIKQFIQISAPDAHAGSDTAFLRTKAVADAALKESRLAWTIFRPGLVWAQQAYGGTSLLRMMAGFPLVQPIVFGTAKVQTVAVDDVAQAVAMSVTGRYRGKDFDLVEPEVQSLEELILKIRCWLGFKKPLAVIHLPAIFAYGCAAIADIAGYLGWRSALRTTALKALKNGVTGDAGAWMAAGGRQLHGFDETLRLLPSTIQERVYARSRLLMPLLIMVLSGFWLFSGIVGLLNQSAAMQVLADNFSPMAAKAIVIGGSVVDILIGLFMVQRSYIRLSCFASVAVSIAYLAGSLLYAPALWMDPLGPMVKVFPVIALALAVAANVEER